MRTQAGGVAGALVALALVALGSGTARGQETQPTYTQESDLADEQARVHFLAGTNYFAIGDYENALREYRRAHALSGRAELLYNLFLCEERLGHLEAAIVALERFLSERPDAENRDTLEQHLATLHDRLQAEQAERAAAEAHAGEQTSTPPPPPVAPEPSPVEERVPPQRASSSGGVTSATAAALVAAGTLTLAWGGLALAALLTDAELAARCDRDSMPACTPDDTNGLLATSIAADVALGLAAATWGLALVLALTTSEDSAPELAWAPWASEDGVGLAARGVW